MVNFVCDACKKSFPGAVHGEDYFTYLNRGLCLACNEKFEDSVRQDMNKKSSYSLSVYKNTIRTKLAQFCR